MQIEFTYTEKDLLDHQLFIISQSKQVRKQRAKGKMFLLLIYTIIGIFLWERNGMVTAAVFFVVCLPLYFIYAYMEKRQYAKHIKNYVSDLVQQRGDRKTSLALSLESIEMTDAETNTLIPRTDLESIYETSTFYTISLKNGKSLLIPKRIFTDTSAVQNLLKDMAEKFGLSYETNLNWKWS
jgi:hypothetical protein